MIFAINGASPAASSIRTRDSPAFRGWRRFPPAPVNRTLPAALYRMRGA